MSTTAPAETADVQAAPAQDGPPLLDVLHNLGSQLAPSDQPIVSQLPQVVGAIVKTLELAGAKVPDEAWPPEPVAVPRPETQHQVHQAQTNSRLDQLENTLGEILAHLRGNS